MLKDYLKDVLQEETQSMLPPSAPPSYEQSQQSQQQQQQGPPQPQNVQIIQEIRYVQAPSFSYRPDTMVCPHCQTQIKTSTKKSLSLVGWAFVIGLCFFQACLCACIPCCMDSCHKVREPLNNMLWLPLLRSFIRWFTIVQSAMLNSEHTMDLAPRT